MVLILLFLFVVIPAKAGIHFDLGFVGWKSKNKASTPLRGAGYFFAGAKK
jgi:hypothetical protein